MNEKKKYWQSIFGKEIEKIDTEDLWIVPYADFMTVLMIFFLMMFAFAYSFKSEGHFEKVISSIQQEMGGEIKKELITKMIEQEKNEQIVSKFDDMINKLKLKKYVTVSSDSEQIKIIFSNPILFGSGKAELKKESKDILHEMVQIVLKSSGNNIVIEGHTDDIPIKNSTFKSNWELSVARAMSVIYFLVNKENIDPKRFACAGYGEFRPILPNDSDYNRSQNRRIEINILSTKI